MPKVVSHTRGILLVTHVVEEEEGALGSVCMQRPSVLVGWAGSDPLAKLSQMVFVSKGVSKWRISPLFF